jgi:8-oxo-dGTP pyrophosphatase MutT (NUDIX family)
MGVRADLVACWPFRVTPAGQLEILLIHRAPGHVFPGLWQCVTGKLEDGETMVAGALRELAEETRLGAREIEWFGETDIINWFHVADVDDVLCEVVFAARLRPDAIVTLSQEHDDLRWCTPEVAHELVVWPAYHRAIEQLEWLVANPEAAEVYRLPDPA